jgi:hypothetical protein
VGKQDVEVDKIRVLGDDGGSMRFLPSTKQIFTTKLVLVQNKMYNIKGACTYKIDSDLVSIMHDGVQSRTRIRFFLLTGLPHDGRYTVSPAESSNMVVGIEVEQRLLEVEFRVAQDASQHLPAYFIIRRYWGLEKGNHGIPDYQSVRRSAITHDF